MTTNDKTKRQYTKPSVRVYELQGHHSMILCASPGGLGDPDNYGNGGDPFGF